VPGDPVMLVAREPCAACDATGQVVSEDWQGYSAWADRRRLTDVDRDEQVEHYFLAVCDMAAVPAVNVACAACDGAGTVDAVVAVTDLVGMVAERFRGAVVPAGELDEVVDQLKQTMTAAALRSQGLADPLDVGSWLRACQEAAEALRTVAELRPRRVEA
jgi:NADPH-dependent ferric siderophore reductase